MDEVHINVYILQAVLLSTPWIAGLWVKMQVNDGKPFWRFELHFPKGNAKFGYVNKKLGRFTAAEWREALRRDTLSKSHVASEEVE